jgi:hypothetical protein
MRWGGLAALASRPDGFRRRGEDRGASWGGAAGPFVFRVL